MIRLDKFLSDMGMGTRSEVKKLLKSGRVLVNGKRGAGPETKVDPEADQILVDGQQVQYEKYVWYMVHKDSGCLTALRDNLHRTVMELLPEEALKRNGLSPVGRLDLDTEGLLLITDDGETAHRLLSPGRHVPKTYFTVIAGEAALSQESVDAFEKGLDIGDDTPTAPAQLKVLPWQEEYGELIAQGDDTGHLCAVLATVREGRYHQIKRMFHAVGQEVLYLKRIAFGPLQLDPDLEKGRSRKLTAEEISSLKQAVDITDDR